MIVYLVSNSPGEVSTFVRPVVDELRRRHPHWSIQVCLVPCPYATGAEARVIRDWPEPPAVWTPWRTTLHWLKGSGRGEPAAVVFLGGDPWHALLLKKRFGLKALAYFSEPTSWERTRWLGGFDALALGYRASPEENGVGDLRVDAVRAALEERKREEGSGRVLALFPGSRWLHLKAALGPFLRVVDQVAAEGVRFLLAASPFVSPERLNDAATRPWELGIAVSRGSLCGDELITEAGNRVEVVWGDPYQVMARCDLALSLPGTNTAELAIAGKPTVVPLNERVPVGGGGLLGLLDRLPGMEGLKLWMKHRKKRRLGHLALPNQLAGRVVMPEFFVRDDLADLSDFVRDLLDDPERRDSIGREAREVMGPPGAAGRLVDRLEPLV